MKTKISMILVLVLLLTSVSVFAQDPMPVTISVGDELVPTLYENTLPFELKQNGDEFTITLEENGSTGYLWTYTISKENHVTFISDEVKVADTDMLGAPSKHSWTFKVNNDGVSTILFKYARSWEKDNAETVDVLVYKNGDKVFIEENQVVSIADFEKNQIELINNVEVVSNNYKVIIEGDNTKQVAAIKTEAGVVMVPVRDLAEGLGFTVKWNEATKSIEFTKGAMWTSIQLDKNAYFKNRMAPAPLSSAPKLIDGKTYVPVEFITEVLNAGIRVENKIIFVSESENAKHEGYVVDIRYNENGSMTITLGEEKGTKDIMKQVIIHTSSDHTITQKAFEIGSYVKVISPMMMTMSLPGQTSGYIIF